MSDSKTNAYADYALKLALARMSSMDLPRRTACSGNARVSKKALLEMLGSKKSPASKIVSDFEANKASAIALVDEYGIDVAASKLGVTKSSLKRKISSNEARPSAYNENFPSNLTRKYLEKNFESWRVSNFNGRTGEACIDMVSESATVKLSVTVSLSSRTT